MAGLSTAMQQQALDNVFPTTGSTDHVAYSTNGTSEAAGVIARTAVGATGWAAASVTFSFCGTKSCTSNEAEPTGESFGSV